MWFVKITGIYIVISQIIAIGMIIVLNFFLKPKTNIFYPVIKEWIYKGIVIIYVTLAVCMIISSFIIKGAL